MLLGNKLIESLPSTRIFRSPEDELLSARQGYLILNPLRVRIDSAEFIGPTEAKITFVLTDHFLASVPISNYDIFVEYDIVSHGNRSDLVKRIAGNIDPQKVTVNVRVPPKEISQTIRIGVRAIHDQDIQGLVIWSEYIDRKL